MPNKGLYLLWVILALLNIPFGASFSLNPSDTRSVTARVFGSLDALYEFIGEDEGFNYLKEDTEVLDPGRNPQMELMVEGMLVDYGKPEVKKELSEMPLGTLEEQLEVLNDKLEAVYFKLFSFAEILVNLSDEDLIAMGDHLVSNPEYYEKVMSDEIDPLSFFTNWEPTVSHPDAIDDDLKFLINSLEKLNIVEAGSIEEDGVHYWNPDADYDMIEDQFLTMNGSPGSKLNDLVNATGIIKIIKSIIKDIKIFFSLILKLIKLVKVLKLKELKICLKIMGTIEKIKKCVMLIKHYLIKKIIKFKKGFPKNVIYKIKALIRLILKIIMIILWEIKMIITEVIVKLYYLMRKIEKKLKTLVRIPIELKIYIKQELYEKLGYAQEDRQEYLWEQIEEFEQDIEDGHNMEDLDSIKLIDEDSLSYAIGSGWKPDDLDKLFSKKFLLKEKKELDRDAYNQEVVFQFSDAKSNNHNSKARVSSLDKREVDSSAKNKNMFDFNINVNISDIGHMLEGINITFEPLQNISNSTVNDTTPRTLLSKASILRSDIWTTILLPVVLFICIRISIS